MKNVCKTQNYNLTANLLIKDKINSTLFWMKTLLTNSGLDLKKEIEIERDNLSFNKIRLVSSGNLIDDYFSLQYQGIQNGSIIYLIPVNYSANISYSTQKEETSKNNNFYGQHHISSQSNSHFRNNEVYRLSDVWFSRIESNPRTFRRLIRRFNDLQNIKKQAKPK